MNDQGIEMRDLPIRTNALVSTIPRGLRLTSLGHLERHTASIEKNMMDYLHVGPGLDSDEFETSIHGQGHSRAHV